MNNESPINQKLVSSISAALSSLEGDITVRNEYINLRDRVVYMEGLFEGVEIPDGADRTLYNLCKRAVNIHTSQFMGRGFKFYTTYNKISEAPEAETAQENAQELGQEEPGETQDPTNPVDPKAVEKMLDTKNKLAQENANVRKKVIDGIIEDNGGMAPWMNRAQMCSSYGFSVVKQWADFKEKKVKQVTLETPQQYYPFFADNNFREREGDAYIYQISENKAYKEYGHILKDDEMFALSIEGLPLQSDGDTSNPLNMTNTNSESEDTRSKRAMVTCIEYTGVRPKFGAVKGQLKEVKRGEETPFNILIVGGKVAQVITEEKKLPTYYLLPNVIEPRRMFPKSDLDESVIQINKTYIEAMSTWATLYQKEVYSTYKAKGFDGQRIPQRIRKATTFIPMSQEQDIEPLNQPGSFGQETKAFIEELKENFVRVAKVGRVLFDDPTINPSSNQALMTTLKGVVDVVEEKQANWNPILKEMFKDALKLAAEIEPALKTVINEEGWNIKVEWPSILRREDATYQQMWLNRFNANTVSLESYMEAMGEDDPTEETDRLRDEMKDPLQAAILSRQLGVLAAQVISPQGPPTPDVKVSLKGQLTPNQEANIADSQGFLDGKFPPSAGPQGNEGAASTDNVNNLGYIEGDQNKAGFAKQISPDGQPMQDQPLPQLTPDQNTGQTASMPGSGAPAVSPQGAINMMQQQGGN